MRVRHRIPSIFNLSMVDVLCCALGCVILIWLINLRDSKKNQEEASSLRETQKTKIDELTAKLQVATARTDFLQARVRTSGKELDVVRSDLNKARDQYNADESRLAALDKAVAAQAQTLDETNRNLTAAQAAAKKNAADLADANKTLADLQDANARLKTDLSGRIQDAKNEAARRASDLADADKKLTDLRAAKARAEADLDDRKKELTLLQTRFTADENAVTMLTKEVDADRKELADARGRADALQAEGAKWRNEAARIKTEADNRFAGIVLTGKRVVFLVDMSGSMDYVDDNHKAPEKWLGVRTAVVKIMRSLPDLEKFQLITFSDKSHFPLGDEGKWQDYDPKTSPDLVFNTLKAITPEGGTNMYVPMQSAFAMRAQGLDTVYLCSDGLPNLGEGVTAEEAKTLTEDERGAKLGAVIRNKLKTDWNRDIPGQARVHIHTVGFFYESPDVGAFLWALARENEGGFVGMSKP